MDPLLVLEQYKKAIITEMLFLKNNGGRKYKVTNGKLIAQSGGMFSYCFDLETELYLTDDAPVTVTVGAASTSGNVVLCEGFQIVIAVEMDMGQNVAVAFASVEPWKLLEALNTKLSQITAKDRIAYELLENVQQPAASSTGDGIPKGQAVAKAHSRHGNITVIWGPPGTGKTHTMAEIAIDSIIRGKRVLIVSHSNISVDGVIWQVSEILRNKGQEAFLKNGQVLRYGHVRDERLARDDYAVAFNYALNKSQQLKKRMDHLRNEKELPRNKTFQYGSDRLRIEKELKSIRTQVRESERECASNALLLATTISKVTVDSLFDGKKYDVVMFDEISMAYVPQLLCAAAYAQEHFIAVGDFRQLSPIAQSSAKEILEKDIFACLGISAGGESIKAHPWLVMLNEQRRMHPDISAFVNSHVYNRMLVDYKNVGKQREAIVGREPFSGSAMNLVDLGGSYCAAAKSSDNSRFNILSAIISFATAVTAEEAEKGGIGIITPYAAQTRLIRAMIRDHGMRNKTGITCATIHQFQGSERNVIIFDAVESYPLARPGWLMSKNENSSVMRLVNVAVTRARGKLITVANTRFWLKKITNTYHMLYRLLKHLLRSGNVVDYRDQRLNQYLDKLKYGNNIKHYRSPDEGTETFLADIDSAQKKIVISIPDGRLDRETERKILKVLYTALSRGVQVLMKSNDYASLPDKWKELCWGTEDAAFPLVMIDGEIIWYGMPPSKLEFKDGTDGYLTICPTVFRITGKNTADVIASLADIEGRVVEGQRKRLLEKAGDKNAQKSKAMADDENGKGEAGLANFVQEHAKCSRCLNPMRLTRGKSGKVYLQCPSCKNMEYLTPDFANWYISKNSVKCPIHKDSIRAGLGKYGVYIRCERGHFMKPDEI